MSIRRAPCSLLYLCSLRTTPPLTGFKFSYRVSLDALNQPGHDERLLRCAHGVTT